MKDYSREILYLKKGHSRKFILAKYLKKAHSRKFIPQISRYFRLAKVSPAKVPSLEVQQIVNQLLRMLLFYSNAIFMIFSDSHNTDDLILRWDYEYCRNLTLNKLLHRTEFTMKNITTKSASQGYVTGTFLKT